MRSPVRRILLAVAVAGLGRGLGAAEPPEAPADGTSTAAPPALAEVVTVTASRVEQRLADVPTSAVVLGAEELRDGGALALDDALRQVPGFTLFRRAGSRAANPTAQGVSLRGVGASGASRAAVLADGVSLNDPFGGWVYWGRVPRTALARVEVVRGGGSELYGSGALAGVVQLVRRRALGGAAGAHRLVGEASVGELDTREGSVFAARGGQRWGITAAAEVLDTAGYFLLAAADRGAADTRAGVRREAVELGVERELAGSSSFDLRLSGYDEERDNGTRLADNATWIGALAASLTAPLAGGIVEVRADGARQGFEQTFTAVAADRTSARVVRSQEVPAESAGVAAQWLRPLGRAGASQRLLAGVELRRVEGESDERIFAVPGAPPAAAVAGGAQSLEALFVEDLWQATAELSFAAALRLDRWENDPGPQPGSARRESALSPRVAALWQVRPELGLTASAYRSFRAPTLNELYRSFRVGDVLTLANAALEAERLTGAELGARWSQPPATVRAVLFWMETEDPVANVTIGGDAELLLRQRRNLGRLRSRGLEIDLERRLDAWTLAAGYLFADARVERFAAARELEGNEVPQTPRHTASAQLRRSGRRSRLGLAARWSGEQFEDDLNQLPLAGAFTLDGTFGWNVREDVEIFLAGENLLDEEVPVGRTPLPTFGSPRLLRLGVAWTLRR